jgi:predicted DNA repair protein MutK
MAGGLVAMLDDVAALARLAASADDVTAAAVRAGSKTVGVVIDDAAVTPGYVIGLPSERESPIIAKIAIGSLRNKLLFILPAALLLSAFAKMALTPILMLGGLYLNFEGAEKIIKLLKGEKAIKEVARINDPAELEARQVDGAIRTDLVLSAE